MPGNNGGSNFGSTSSNPNDGTVYVISYDIPAIMRLLTPEEAAARGGRGRGGAGAAAGPGLAVFQRDCQVCHGADRAGTPNGASLVGVAGRLSAEEIRSTVTNGKGRMPPFPHLLPADVDAVVSYLVAADAGGRGGRGRGGDAAARDVPAWPGRRIRTGCREAGRRRTRWRRRPRVWSSGVPGRCRSSRRALHDERLRSLREHRQAAVHHADVVRPQQGNDQMAACRSATIRGSRAPGSRAPAPPAISSSA